MGKLNYTTGEINKILDKADRLPESGYARYQAIAYEEAPDLASLETWEDPEGKEHPFLPGDDIYVRDETEPSGYANYKLAYSTAGLSWIRIPQVAEGWKVVMVKQQNGKQS